jgi:hypothetical protein
MFFPPIRRDRLRLWGDLQQRSERLFGVERDRHSFVWVSFLDH